MASSPLRPATQRVDAPAAAGRFRVRAPLPPPRAKPNESAEQALERRKRESKEVIERVIYISNAADWEREMEKVGAGGGLGVTAPDQSRAAG